MKSRLAPSRWSFFWEDAPVASSVLSAGGVGAIAEIASESRSAVPAEPVKPVTYSRLASASVMYSAIERQAKSRKRGEDDGPLP